MRTESKFANKKLSGIGTSRDDRFCADFGVYNVSYVFLLTEFFSIYSTT